MVEVLCIILKRHRNKLFHLAGKSLGVPTLSTSFLDLQTQYLQLKSKGLSKHFFQAHLHGQGTSLHNGLSPSLKIPRKNRVVKIHFRKASYSLGMKQVMLGFTTAKTLCYRLM